MIEDLPFLFGGSPFHSVECEVSGVQISTMSLWPRNDLLVQYVSTSLDATAVNLARSLGTWILLEGFWIAPSETCSGFILLQKHICNCMSIGGVTTFGIGDVLRLQCAGGAFLFDWIATDRPRRMGRSTWKDHGLGQQQLLLKELIDDSWYSAILYANFCSQAYVLLPVTPSRGKMIREIHVTKTYVKRLGYAYPDSELLVLMYFTSLSASFVPRITDLLAEPLRRHQDTIYFLT